MMPEVTVPALLVVGGIAVLAAVYLWSPNAGRRQRAWRLLRLLVRR